MTDELRRRSPRKRLTREEQKALTRQRLLESAHAVIALKGYEGASVDEIAADAGYSRGAFYSNFPNKSAIMEALIESGFESDVAGIMEMSQANDPEMIKEGFREMARRYSNDPENTLWSLEFQLAAVRHPELRERYAKQFDRLRKGVRGMLVDTFRSRGVSRPEETERFADVFIVMLSGLSLMKLLYPDTFDQSLFEKAFAALVHGIPETLTEE